MPAALPEAWPLAWPQHVASSAWFPLVAPARPRAAGTAFDAQEPIRTYCKEGFRCVSRVARFGREHDPEDNVTGSSPTHEDEESKDYEWDCPDRGQWSSNSYESGSDPKQCSQEGDCLCIARDSADSTTTMNEGVEKITAQFDVDQSSMDPTGRPVKPLDAPITVVPHYAIRLFGGKQNPDDMHSSLGSVMMLPRKAFSAAYKLNTPQMQFALDTQKKWIQEKYTAWIDGKHDVCNSSKPDRVSSAQATEALQRIRRYQILQQDCIVARDMVHKISKDVEGEKFDGMYLEKHKLNCFKSSFSDERCRQLNCYTSPEDEEFTNHLAVFKKEMDKCRPETDMPQELPIEEGGRSPGNAGGATSSSKEIPEKGEQPASVTGAGPGAEPKTGVGPDTGSQTQAGSANNEQQEGLAGGALGATCLAAGASAALRGRCRRPLRVKPRECGVERSARRDGRAFL